MSSKWKIEKHRSGNYSITNNNSWIGFCSKEELRDLYESLDEFIIKEDAPFQVGDVVVIGVGTQQHNVLDVNRNEEGQWMVKLDHCGPSGVMEWWVSIDVGSGLRKAPPVKKIKSKKKSVRCPLQKNQTVYNGSDVGKVVNIQKLTCGVKWRDERTPRWDIEICWQDDYDVWSQHFTTKSAHDINKLIKTFSRNAG